jgi:hypothetical protein
VTIGNAEWAVKLDNGNGNSYHSLRGAAGVVNAMLAERTPCEIWHYEDGERKLWRRYEPQADDHLYFINDYGHRERKHDLVGGPHDEPPEADR